MSDTQLTDIPKGRSRPFEIYVAVSATAFLVSYVATYVYSFYLQKMTFDSQFHPGADFPGSLVDPAVHDPNKYNVGVHFFGDFWTTLLRTQEASPYLVRPGVGGSSYPPFAQFLYEPLTWLPYPLALLIFLVGSTAILVIPFWRALSAYEPHIRATFIIVGIMLTYPFLFSLDRGNNVVIATGFLLFGVLSLHEGKPKKAATYFALAAAIKIYPVFFLLMFVSGRQWKALWRAIWVGTTLTLVPVLTYEGGLVANLKALYANSSYFRDGGAQIALNHSLASFLNTLSLGGFNPGGITRQLIEHYSLVVLLLVLISTLFLLASRDDFYSIAIACLLNTLLIPITYGYTLTVLYPLLISLATASGEQLLKRLIAILLAILFCAKGMPIGPAGSSLLNYLNPSIQLVILFLTFIAISHHDFSRLFTRK